MKFEPHGQQPMEYERWILGVERVDGYHPEIALYFRRVLDHTLDTDHRYLREVSSDRVHLQPGDNISHTEIESRI